MSPRPLAWLTGMALLCLSPLVGEGAAADPRPDERWLGRFLMEVRVTSTARVPVLGTERSTAVSLLLVDMESDGGRLIQRHRTCSVRVEGGPPGVRMVIPSAFVRGLAERSYLADLREQAGGWTYTADLGVEAIGFDADLTRGEIPAEPDAVGVRDPDGDGEPGATVEVHLPLWGRARIYVVQRSHLILNGRQTAPGRIEGEVEIPLLEQRALGANPSFFRHAPHLTPEPSRSGFTLVRVPEGTGCEEVRRNSPLLLE